jgi:hypothetical protein
MSPKIGIVIDTRGYIMPSSLRPLDRLRAACNVAETEGKRIRFDGAHGVARHSVTGGWFALNTLDPRRVSPLGAALLVAQPNRKDDDIIAATAEALNASVDWVWGMWDGFENVVQTGRLQGPSKDVYQYGLRAGHLLFGELTVECIECGERRYRRDLTCHTCE